MQIVRAEGLRKTFFVRKYFRTVKSIKALDGLDFEIKKGEIFGILGPNGAGKSTTIKMLTTLLLPDQGSVTLFGLDTFRNRKEIRKRINVVFGGERGLYWKLTAEENLHFFARMYEIPSDLAMRRIDSSLRMLGLNDFRKVPVQRFSSGMKQKLHFARALINDPELVFLDEPTNALDPKSASDLRKVIADLQRNGKTVVLTTHNMREAELLCNQILLINEGRIVRSGSPSSLKRFFADSAIAAEVHAPSIEEPILLSLREVAASTKVRRVDDARCEILLQGKELGVEVVFNLLQSHGLRISSIRETLPDLEEVYLAAMAGDAHAQ